MFNWQHVWKAILAFLSLVATNAVADLTASGKPWPETGAEWLRWIVSVVGGTLLVYGKANAPKSGQADAAVSVDVAVDDNPPTIPIPVQPVPRRKPVI